MSTNSSSRRAVGKKCKASGDTYRTFQRRRRSKKEEWRVNAIDPDTLPIACEPCRCHKRSRVRPAPYNLRDRTDNKSVKTIEEITDEEIAKDIQQRIASIPIPGRADPIHENPLHLGHELKLRLAMTSFEVKEDTPESGERYTYRTIRPEKRMVEIHDEIDEEYEHEITLKIMLENCKRSGLWRKKKHVETP